MMNAKERMAIKRFANGECMAECADYLEEDLIFFVRLLRDRIRETMAYVPTTLSHNYVEPFRVRGR